MALSHAVCSALDYREQIRSRPALSVYATLKSGRNCASAWGSAEGLVRLIRGLSQSVDAIAGFALRRGCPDVEIIDGKAKLPMGALSFRLTGLKGQRHFCDAAGDVETFVTLDAERLQRD